MKLSQRKINLSLIMLFICMNTILYAQGKRTVIKSGSEKIQIQDGKNYTMDWRLEPKLKPDIYYVNVPFKKRIVRFKTDRDRFTVKTQPGKSYDFIVLLNEKDSCHIRIASVLPPDLPQIDTAIHFPVKIAFRMVGSRIFFDGKVNGKEVVIQLDLGAGTSVVNRNSVQKLGLEFNAEQLVSNTDGTKKEQTSKHNLLNIGTLTSKDVALTTVGNMEPFEDLIIGNSFFRNYIIEIDYDKLEVTVHKFLPGKVRNYRRCPVFFEQNRPKFKAGFEQNHRKYEFWFLFDTGRDGTMLIGEDFTASGQNWEALQPLTTINGRKIIRLNTFIAGTEFRDIVTNAADPGKPNGRPSLFGNQILNHFNCILDNRSGVLYLQPNRKMDDTYFDYKSYQVEMMKKNKK